MSSLGSDSDSRSSSTNSIDNDINNNIDIDNNNNNSVINISIFEKIRLEKERKNKEIEEYEKFQRENDYPNGAPISLEKENDYSNNTTISLNKQNDNTLNQLPPQQFTPEQSIHNNDTNIGRIKDFKIVSPKKKKFKIKCCKIQSNTMSLLILIFGFLIPFIWIFGFCYIKSYHSKSRVYGLVSIILFFIIISAIIPVVPIVVIYIKNGGFGCNNCTYSGDYEYD